jgi:phosphotriesterase-related protein
MPSVMTVCGAIDAGELGFTLPHEHIFIDLTAWPGGRTVAGEDAVIDSERHGQLMVEELSRFRAAGGRSIVDVTVKNMGGDPLALRRVSEATGLHIIAGCGWYRDSYLDADLYYRPTGQVAEELIDEIEHGIAGADVRPGIIGEIGADYYHVTATEERCLRAAAMAQRSTGLAITTHLPKRGVAFEALDILAEYDVPPERVVIGHADQYDALEYQMALLERGVFIEFEIIRPHYPYARVLPTLDMTVELVRRGYARQLLLSRDVCACSMLRQYGGGGFDYLITDFLPQLRTRGIDEESIYAMTVENPRRVLAT